MCNVLDVAEEMVKRRRRTGTTRAGNAGSQARMI